MRLLLVLAALPVAALAAVIAATNVFEPPPARDRLPGVRVAVESVQVDPAVGDRHRLTVAITVMSPRDLDECLAFALDQPFAGRRLTTSGDCIRPRSVAQSATLVLASATDDDLTYPSHTLVWGVAGGRCGLVLEAFGVCVVDQAGTVPVELPSRSPLPSFIPFGSLEPFFSLPPFP